MRSKLLAAAAAAALTAACGGADEGGLTAEDNRQLDEAAELLELPSDSLTAPDDAELGNGEAPSAESGDLLVTDEDSVDEAGNGQ